MTDQSIKLRRKIESIHFFQFVHNLDDYDDDAELRIFPSGIEIELEIYRRRRRLRWKCV